MSQQAVGTPSKLTDFLKDKTSSSLSLLGLGLKVTQVCLSKLKTSKLAPDTSGSLKETDSSPTPPSKEFTCYPRK